MYQANIRTIACAAVLIAAATLSTAQAQSIKLGVFDPQRVSESTKMGQQVQTQLTTFRDGKQAQIDKMESDVGELRRQLEQQALSLSPDRRTGLQKEIERKRLELQSTREAAGRELQLEVSAAQSNFEEKLLLTVNSFAKDEGFTLILDASLVVWADKSVDVTTGIVDRFNMMFPVDGE